jgi:hypothetical protein
MTLAPASSSEKRAMQRAEAVGGERMIKISHIFSQFILLAAVVRGEIRAKLQMNAMNVASDGGFFASCHSFYEQSERRSCFFCLARYNLEARAMRQQQWDECGWNASFAGMSQAKGISF